MLIGQTTVLAEQVADLAATDADVTGRDVAVLTDVAVQLRHEGLAETHDLSIGLALRVKVGATLAATDGQTGQGVLEDLLETEELDDAQVDARVESQAALVGAECGIELDTEATVHPDVTIVRNPRDAEDDLTLRLAETLDEAVVVVVRILLQNDL